MKLSRSIKRRPVRPFVGATMVSLSLAAALIVSGYAVANDEPPLPHALEHRLENLADCAAINLATPRGETNTALNFEYGLLTIDLHEEVEQTITVYYEDPACRSHAVLGPIIDHVLESAMADIGQECANLAKLLAAQGDGAAGQIVARGEAVDVDKLRDHMNEWC